MTDLVVLLEKIDPSKGRKQYQCERCPDMFLSLLSLKKHIGTHPLVIHEPIPTVSNTSEAEATKEIQNSISASSEFSAILNLGAGVSLSSLPKVKKTNRKSDLQSNEGKRGRGRPKKVDTKGNYFTCSICEDYFYTEASLTLHIRKKHTTDLPYQCESCAKRFDTKGALTYHSESHKEGKHQCSYCSKAYRKSYLENHIRTHTGEKPFSCESCDKTFSSRENLKNHLNTHTKPYKCGTCSDSFSSWNSLKRHSERHN